MKCTFRTASNRCSRYILVLCTLVNFLLYVDRGIIPGASTKFVAFIQRSVGVVSPDAYLGLLQSSFIAGLSLSCPLFGHLVHYVYPMRLMGCGLMALTIAASVSAIAKKTSSFAVLLFARMVSGIGEAAFLSVASPLIVDHAGPNPGKWLGLFFTMIPCGTAAGMIFGALIANSRLEWGFAFVIEALILAPIAVLCLLMGEVSVNRTEETVYVTPPTPSTGLSESASPHSDIDTGVILSSSSFEREDSDTSGATGNRQTNNRNETVHPSFCFELRQVIRSSVWWGVVVGSSAYSAVLIAHSTFGSLLFVNLGYFKSENESSVMMGFIVSITGIVGTLGGGFIFDRHRKLEGTDTGRETLMMVMKDITILGAAGAAFMVITPAMTPRWAFLAALFVGLMLLFATQVGVSLGMLLSVPFDHRSFAIATGTLMMHTLGDVPSPIIVGWLKDYLAPHCSHTDTGTSQDCVDERNGLRYTILGTNLWLLVMVGGFWFSYWNVSSKRFNRIESFRTGMEEPIIQVPNEG